MQYLLHRNRTQTHSDVFLNFRENNDIDELFIENNKMLVFSQNDRRAADDRRTTRGILYTPTPLIRKRLIRNESLEITTIY